MCVSLFIDRMQVCACNFGTSHSLSMYFYWISNYFATLKKVCSMYDYNTVNLDMLFCSHRPTIFRQLYSREVCDFGCSLWYEWKRKHTAFFRQPIRPVASLLSHAPCWIPQSVSTNLPFYANNARLLAHLESIQSLYYPIIPLCVSVCGALRGSLLARLCGMGRKTSLSRFHPIISALTALIFCCIYNCNCQAILPWQCICSAARSKCQSRTVRNQRNVLKRLITQNLHTIWQYVIWMFAKEKLKSQHLF